MTLKEIVNSFFEAIQDFGDSMTIINDEIKSDIEESKQNTFEREKIDKENLEKIWGKKSKNDPN